ncbi:hypothetical protein [Desulfovibrio sp. TomC]|uniref:hypothetical protein n=1 Tax=Desulfovibrio sp. TomC TaxID=1562888 RepID=UPI000574A28B|nr:hypothetical protein [Desulfovibrio sp. TomC]KHK03187.1 hypothetical protein NY78_1251 [Desulfovibrio sp. TomC]
MLEACQDPLAYLVDQLCCRVYLDGAGNVRLGFSRRHDLTDMMTAQGIARSNAGELRARLRQSQGGSDAARPEPAETSMVEHVALGAFCPLV